MNVREAAVRHSRARRDRVMSVGSFFGVAGGPLAWYAQICAGYALASDPCFAQGQPRLAPLAGYGWTWPAIVAVWVAAVAVALAAFVVSWRTYVRELGTDDAHVEESTRERRRFLALWGMLLGGGFAMTTLLTAFAFLVLPRCAS